VQVANGDIMLYGIRNTDTSPTGNFIQFKNTAANTTLFQVGITGNISAAGTSTLVGQVTLGVSGTTAGALAFVNATTGSILISPPTGALGSQTLTLPDVTDTLIGKATTDTLTNKTYDTAGTGNTFKINGTTISAVTGSGSAVLATSPSLTTPNIGAATGTTLSLGTDNSVAGTVTTANGSAAAHTVWSSGATTTNTIAGFTVAPTTGDLVSCTTAATTCTLTDAGFLAANVVTASGTLTSTALMTGGGSKAAQTPSATSTLDSSGNLTLAGTINKVTITTPATAATLTIANNKTLATSNTVDVANATVNSGGLVYASSTVNYATSTAQTTHGVWLAEGAGNAPLSTGAGTAGQMLRAGGSGADPTYISFPEHMIIPAANCNNATAGAGFSIPASNAPTVACRAGTNNLGGVLQWANNNTTTNAQFTIHLPADWDTSQQPYVNIQYGSGANTSGTVKWTVSTACSKSDGSVSDDPSFNAESASTGKTMAVANREWAESEQLTAVTSGNNCIAGSLMIVKLTSGNGTATSTVNLEQVMVTIPRLLTVQAE
jgi:hypothetical protein